MSKLLIRKKLSKYAIIITSVLIILACSPKMYVDISKQQPYSAVLGLKLQSKIKLLANGVTFHPNYKGDADYVFLMSPPGNSGPQVKFTESLPKGVELKVVKVLRSDNLFGKRIFYEVEDHSNQWFPKYPMLIKVFGEIESSSRGLNLEEFTIK